MSGQPIISVVMPVYNGEKHLKEAIDSILNQTFRDFEFIILNDGSTDRTEDIISTYADERIRYVKNEVNLQIARTLNRGIELAKGKYIARMDADDISLPERFEKQVEYMEAHLSVTVCGTGVQLIGHRKGLMMHPTSHNDICCQMLFGTPLAHPSVILRRADLMKSGVVYESDRKRAEDLAFWVTLSKHTELNNMPDVLLRYRTYDPLKLAKLPAVKAAAMDLQLGLIKELGVSVSMDERALHQKISIGEYEATELFVKACGDWLLKINQANVANPRFNTMALETKLSTIWLNVCKNSSCLGLRIWQAYWKHGLSKKIKLQPRAKLTLLLRCLIRYSREQDMYLLKLKKRLLKFQKDEGCGK